MDKIGLVVKRTLYITSPCLFFIITLFVFIGCKKDFHNVNGNPGNPAPVTDSIGLGATEEGPAVYRDSITDTNSISGYSDKLSYYPGDSVYLYLSGPAQNNASISLNDMNRATVFTIAADITRQTITTKKP